MKIFIYLIRCYNLIIELAIKNRKFSFPIFSRKKVLKSSVYIRTRHARARPLESSSAGVKHAWRFLWSFAIVICPWFQACFTDSASYQLLVSILTRWELNFPNFVAWVLNFKIKRWIIKLLNILKMLRNIFYIWKFF